MRTQIISLAAALALLPGAGGAQTPSPAQPATPPAPMVEPAGFLDLGVRVTDISRLYDAHRYRAHRLSRRTRERVQPAAVSWRVCVHAAAVSVLT